MRRRERFATDPAGFATEWAAPQAELAARVERAAALLADVRVADAHYGAIARLVTRSGVGSHRADLSVLECTKALAALAGRATTTKDDIVGAATLALPHRRPVDPFGPAEPLDVRELSRTLEDVLEPEPERKKAGPAAAR
jgi:Mg-chelatase subunit ChlI